MHQRKTFITISFLTLLCFAGSQFVLHVTGGVLAAGVPSVSFATPVNYTVGSLPFANAVADFNGDHIPDIAVVNENSNNVSVLLGNGDGTFQAAVNYTVGTSPSAITAVDLNHDGVPDLAVADELGQTIAVLINKADGTGTFNNAVLYSAGQAPRGIVAGDLRGIGIQDLVVANNLGNNVTVFLGNGDGTFKAGVNYPADVHPKSVALGLFNSDGILDIACANHDSNDVSILMGNGDGTFKAAVNYPVGLNPRHVIVADFNKDGKQDLVTANGGATTISLLYGNGDGTFQPKVDYTAGSSPRWLAVDDYNGDGFLDVATSNYNGGNVSVLMGTGSSTAGSEFGTPFTFNVGANPTGIVNGDFNGDGKPDLAVTIGGLPTAPNTLMAVLLNIPIVISPNTLTFPTQVLGTKSAVHAITLTNTAPNSLTISSIAFTGANASDFAQTNNCGSALSGKASCTIKVTFTPGNINARNASLVITDSAPGGSQTVPLKGTGTAASFTPPKLTFAAQTVGTSSPQQALTLTNVSGGGTLVISGITITGVNAADYTQTNNCSSVGPKASCTINVTFTPKATGTRSGFVTVTDNGGGSPQRVTLTGTGQ
jgi:hypothetical protein